MDNAKTKTKKKFSMGKFQEQSSLFILCIPALLCFIIWNYVPMFGLIIAFKDYTYDAGILGSEWVGFDNFKFFFAMQDLLLNGLNHGLLPLLQDIQDQPHGIVVHWLRM